jgi:hypothetical protein
MKGHHPLCTFVSALRLIHRRDTKVHKGNQSQMCSVFPRYLTVPFVWLT